MTAETKRSLPFFGIGKIIPFMRRYRTTIVIMAMCGLTGSAVDIVLPLFQRYALNHFVGENTLDTLPIFIAAYVAMVLFAGWTNYIACSYAMKVEVSVNRDLRNAAFDHLQTLSFSYFNQNSVGYIHARVMSDTDRIAGTLAWGIMESVWYVAYLVLAIVMMLVLNWKLALCVIAAVPAAVVMGSIFQKKMLKYQRRVRESNSHITSAFNEGISGAKTIKTLVIEDKTETEFDGLTAEMKRLSLKHMHFRSLFMSGTAFVCSIALAVVLWRGGIISAEGVMLIGTLSAFISYAQGMMEPIQFLVQVISSLINVQVNVERFTRLMETQPDVADSPEVIEKYGDDFSPKRENWEPLHGDVEFCDVSFRYPDGDDYVLEHFNLKIPQGTNVAIVGETGAGKSTLVNLVCRFFEPTSGKILIDGVDARERSQLWLHSNIGYVLQTPHLFSGTILENLRYGNRNASMEQIEAAVKAVSADKMISRLPDGYDTVLGEGGGGLSTGEKQLLSFARALLADPRIFVLDEATSSVDTVTEQLIQNAIDKVMNGRTSFVIAHRLSTIRKADLILVVSDGKIIERGTHAELMRLNGEYRKLYTMQYREEQYRSLT